MTGLWRLASRMPIAALASGLALLCVACGSGSSGKVLVPEAQFEPDACPTSVASLPELANARCGYLVVPENRVHPNGQTIRLPVATIPSVSQPPAGDPVVHLSGGPGADALGDAAFLVPAGLNQKRDLIIMGQRGTLDSEPELTCPEIDRFNAQAVGLFYDSPLTEALHVAATKACHDRLAGEGIDLSAYNTAENERDFEDLRQVMGIAQWNVYGYSYGTYLALSLMRDHPEAIRSVTIDSVVPPSVASLGWTWSNVAEAFNNLFRACAAAARLRQKIRRPGQNIYGPGPAARSQSADHNGHLCSRRPASESGARRWRVG